MSKIQELRQKRATLIDSLKAINAKAEAENRSLTEAEEKEFNEKEEEATAISNRIDREERTQRLDSESGKRSPAVYEPAGETRREQSIQNSTSTGGFRSFGEFIGAVVQAGSPRGSVDPRLIEDRAASGGSSLVSSDGGFLIQKDFAQEILDRAYKQGVLSSRVRRAQISQNANGLKMNAISETSRADGSRYGGVQVYWAAEAGNVAASRPKFRQMEIGLGKLMGLCYLTDELASDAVALNSIIPDMFAKEFAFVIDNSILRGLGGAGEMLGVLNSPSLVTVSKESGQSADTVLKDNIVKMRSRLWSGSRPNSVWFINQDVEPQLNLLTLGDLGAYFPAGTFANQPYDQLFGRPVVSIEQASTLGDVGDIMLLDLNEYMMIEKGGLNAESSIHVRFVYDEMALRFTYRVGGMPLWNSTLTPFKGSATQSPFIALEAR